METSLWKERYRPRKVAECILPDRIKVLFQQMVDKDDILDCLLEGAPGCGKTTIARAVCEELGVDYILINGSDERGVDVIRTKVSTFASTMSLVSDRSRKVVIFDEADHLTPDAQGALRGVIDAFEKTCRFIFTCNYKNRLIPALHSRAIPISFTFSDDEKKHMMAAFMQRSIGILKENSVSFEPPVLAAVIKKYAPDFRRILGELQAKAKFGPIDASVLASLQGIQVDRLVEFMKAKNFREIRQFFAENPGLASAEFFDGFYKQVSSKLAPASVPTAVLILADYQYKAAFVVNQEINAVACCVQLMVDCQFV